jgi:hypothetical protein
MLNICQTFAAEYDAKCNASKSLLLLFNCPINIKDIELNNIYIQVSESGIHIGHHIGNNCNYGYIIKGISDLMYITNFFNIYMYVYVRVYITYILVELYVSMIYMYH